MQNGSSNESSRCIITPRSTKSTRSSGRREERWLSTSTSVIERFSRTGAIVGRPRRRKLRSTRILWRRMNFPGNKCKGELCVAPPPVGETWDSIEAAKKPASPIFWEEEHFSRFPFSMPTLLPSIGRRTRELKQRMGSIKVAGRRREDGQEAGDVELSTIGRDRTPGTDN